MSLSEECEEDSSTSNKHSDLVQQERLDSPAPSCVSMKSHWSIDHPPLLKDGDPSSGHSLVQQERSDSSAPSCVSLKSDESKDCPLWFKNGNPSTGHSEVLGKRTDSPESSCPRLKSDRFMEPPQMFKDEDPSSEYRPDSECTVTKLQEDFKLNLKQKFQCLNEVTTNQETPTPLSEIYTELYITEGDSGEVNNEHEVRLIEAASRRTATEDTPIKCNDIFKPLSEQDKPIRTVLTKGVAGIGKTVSVQKFIVDWTEGKANQDVHFIFPLPFRELNLMKDQKLSLVDLLHTRFKKIKEMEISRSHKVLFIFDGLDECRFTLDFQSTVRLDDVTQSSSVNMLLTNLIKGNLLPSALIWITSRPAAADQIPSECVDRLTEVRGFSDPQKEEYFRKRISDQSLTNRIITHLKTSRSLYIMCHIPVFCWVSATVLERMLGEAESGETPKTLTQMYTHFIIQTKIIREKYQKSDKKILLKLGQLAFQQLMKGNLIFYEEDLRECGIDIEEASVYSGVCTQIFREESGLYQNKVYCFVHLSIQEHLAALYVHLTFMKQKRNVLKQSQSSKLKILRKISDVHKSAVDQALQSKNGHLDLFLRFLLGLSLESNQTLLQELVTHTRSSSHSKEKTVKYINKKISENLSAEKSINLFHSLNELDDRSLVKQVQQYLQSGSLNGRTLSSSQWSAVVFVLLTSGGNLDEFVLQKYNRSNDVFLKLLPVFAESRTADLSNCNLTWSSCAALASVLSSESSSLKQLNLDGNKLGDSGVKLLSAGLESPLCKLETLWMYYCNFTYEGCAALTSALKSNPSHLKELNLSYNKLGDSGVKLLSAVLGNPLCKLESLRLCNCNITDEGCAALTSALKSNPLYLKALYLSENNLGDSGVKLLSAVLENPLCKLETLWLVYCNITDKSFVALTSALKSQASYLRELNMCLNNLGDSGGKLLSAVLKNPLCKLEMLWLGFCNITDEGCAALISALKSHPSHLTALNLTNSELGDSGVKLLSAVMENPLCKLESLKLQQCNITDEGCAALTSALKSNPSHLRELHLSFNKLGDSGVKLLSAVLENPLCILEILWLMFCNITDEGCAALASALKSNPSHLRDLNLCFNDQIKKGLELLLTLQRDKHYRLQDLRCGVYNVYY
ncbi:NACHT, LRR and PYD domains-containing protein 3-like isoform X1 [Colossoma macropomum]|uniref:NACHT, LRR and PYD domains-containing protein 3-like isoform X1 n=1 Tax=Colossoma macropomum TaxID=42526 RepID=UPI001863DB4F|nr:NACHT, LRR and PYD domains-containing protein 3-like isoform X1 [Colossoma macropomum]